MMLSDFKAGDWVFTATNIELEYIKEVNKKGWYILTNGYIETTIFRPDETNVCWLLAFLSRDGTDLEDSSLFVKCQ